MTASLTRCPARTPETAQNHRPQSPLAHVAFTGASR
jgi:hypothetical protein